MQQRKLARSLLQEIIEIDDSYWRAHRELASLHLGFQLEKCKYHIEQALLAKPGDPEAILYEKTNAYYLAQDKEKKLQPTITTLLQLAKENKNNVRVQHLTFAFIIDESNDHNLQSLIEEMLRLHPNSTAAHLCAAEFWKRAGNDIKCLEHRRKMHELNPVYDTLSFVNLLYRLYYKNKSSRAHYFVEATNTLQRYLLLQTDPGAYEPIKLLNTISFYISSIAGHSKSDSIQQLSRICSVSKFFLDKLMSSLRPNAINTLSALHMQGEISHNPVEQLIELLEKKLLASIPAALTRTLTPKEKFTPVN